MCYATSMTGKIYSFYREWPRSLKVCCYSLLASGNWSSDLAAKEKLKSSNKTKGVSKVVPSVPIVISKEQSLYHCMDRTLLVLLCPCLVVKRCVTWEVTKKYLLITEKATSDKIKDFVNIYLGELINSLWLITKAHPDHLASAPLKRPSL